MNPLAHAATERLWPEDILSAHALVRFEVARRYLGHKAVLRQSDWYRMAGALDGTVIAGPERYEVVGGEGPAEALCDYAVALKAAQDAEAEGNHFPGRAVLPVVNVANFTVRHTTGTGNTTLRLVCTRQTPRRWEFYIDRAEGAEPLATAHPVLALLAQPNCEPPTDTTAAKDAIMRLLISSHEEMRQK